MKTELIIFLLQQANTLLEPDVTPAEVIEVARALVARAQHELMPL